MKTWISWDTGRRLVYLEWTCRKCKQVVTVSNPLRGDAEVKMQNAKANHVCQEQAVSQSPFIYQGEHVCVREIKKRNGKTGYALCRPDNLSAVLEEFTVLGYAVNIARYIDAFGGNYDADHRRAAKHYARGMSDAALRQVGGVK